jgi:hypothetical protein
MSDKQPPQKPASNVSTGRIVRSKSFDKVPTGRAFLPWLAEVSQKRGFLTWLATYVRRSRRQLANLARKYEIPRAKNGYNFDWGANLDATVTLIRDLTRFKKGNRKRRPKRRSSAKLLDQFGRAVHRAAKLTAIDKIEVLQKQIRDAPQSRLRTINNSILRLMQVEAVIARRLQKNDEQRTMR